MRADKRRVRYCGEFGLWLSLVERLVRDERQRNTPISVDVLSLAFHR